MKKKNKILRIATLLLALCVSMALVPTTDTQWTDLESTPEIKDTYSDGSIIIGDPDDLENAYAAKGYLIRRTLIHDEWLGYDAYFAFRYGTAPVDTNTENTVNTSKSPATADTGGLSIWLMVVLLAGGSLMMVRKKDNL